MHRSGLECRCAARSFVSVLISAATATLSRRARNHAALPNDLVGWWAVALLQLCLLLFKTVLRERQPLLAAVNTTNAVTALALAALIRRRPRLYAAARELLLFLASLHLSFVMVNGGEWQAICIRKTARRQQLSLLPLPPSCMPPAGRLMSGTSGNPPSALTWHLPPLPWAQSCAATATC